MNTGTLETQTNSTPGSTIQTVPNPSISSIRDQARRENLQKAREALKRKREIQSQLSSVLASQSSHTPFTLTVTPSSSNMSDKFTAQRNDIMSSPVTVRSPIFIPQQPFENTVPSVMEKSIDPSHPRLKRKHDELIFQPQNGDTWWDKYLFTPGKDLLKSIGWAFVIIGGPLALSELLTLFRNPSENANHHSPPTSVVEKNGMASGMDRFAGQSIFH